MIENNQILVEGKWFDMLYLYQFLKRLTTPFEKTEAFKLGIIDKDGNVLRKRNTLTTPEEKNAYTYFDTLVFNLKKLLGRLPFGKTMLASFVAGLLLLREEKNHTFLVIQEADQITLEKTFMKLYETVVNNEIYKEPISQVRSMINEQKMKEDMGTAAVPTTQEPVMTPSAVKKYHQANKKGGRGIARRNPPVGTGTPFTLPPNNEAVDKQLRPSDYYNDVADRVESHGDYKVFPVDTKTFMSARNGKGRYERYDKYVGNSPLKEHIREYAMANTNKPVILKDECTGQICFLKYGTEARNTVTKYYGQ